ncbi:MAG: hypothetical protein P3C10_09050 [Gemmatimonadota bacterium]|nr:hypothetical protein [Gemmatimonadota bacterium]
MARATALVNVRYCTRGALTAAVVQTTGGWGVTAGGTTGGVGATGAGVPAEQPTSANDSSTARGARGR